MEVGGESDIIAIQEPWVGATKETMDMSKFDQTVGHAGYDILIKKTEGEKKARVMWMVRKDIGIKYTINEEVWKDEWDASVMEIETTKGIIRIVNIYNQNHRQREGWCMNRIPANIARDQTTLILGDFNAHSSEWNTHIITEVREQQILEVMERENMLLLNEVNRITFDNGRTRSVLDLAWITAKDIDHTKWEIRSQDEVASDHSAITITVGMDQQMCVAPTAARWRFQEANWERVVEKVGEEKKEKEEEWRNAVGRKDWDQAATILTSIIQKGIKEGVPKARPSWKSKKWFDVQVKEKRRELAGFARWKKGASTMGEDREAEWRKKRNEYFRLIREKKSEMWNKFVQEAEGRQMWGIWKMTSSRRTTKIPTITNPADNTTRTTFQGKEELFFQKHFPASTSQEVEHEEEEGGCDDVTSEEAWRAIRAQGQMKAAGEDEIPAIAITKSWDTIGDWITEGYNGMLRDGYHPTQWRKAVVAIIPKPNKANYTTTKSYRPISLLATLGKGLERVVAARLMRIGEGPKGLHRDQWGGRRGRSAETCIGHLVDRINNGQRKGKKVTLIAMDVAQAFPSVNRDRLANTMREEEVPENLIKWVRSFMTGRQASIRFDGEQGKWRKVNNGIPQGSPVSPILFNMFLAPLLRQLEEKAIRRGIEATFPTFIDDVTIEIESESWEKSEGEREELIETAYAWAEENGVEFEEDKFEWMRMRREKGEEEIELRGGTKKAEKEVVKILGVWIDKEMNWKRHVMEKIGRGKKAAAMVKRLGKGGSGMGTENMRTMYLGTARAVMEYGSQAWWKGQKGFANRMDKANEQAARRIGGSYRTAPGAAVLAEAGIQPTAIRMDNKAAQRALKAIKAPNRSPEGTLIRSIVEEENEKDKEYRQEKRKERKGKRRGMERGMEIIEEIIGKKQWKKVEGWDHEERGEEEENHGITIKVPEMEKEKIKEQRSQMEGAEEIMVFVDGAKKEKGGVGVWRSEEDNRSWKIGGGMEIEDVELLAIAEGIKEGVKWCKKEGRGKLRIRSDSTHALNAIDTGRDMMAREVRTQGRKAKQRGVEVTVEWTKAHKGTKGNEAADRLAKAARDSTGPSTHKTTITIRHIAKALKERVEKEWATSFENEIPCRKGKNYTGNPQKARKWKFPNDDRRRQVLISRLRTGHINSGNYLFNIGKRPTAGCPCGDDKQDVKHILTRCRKWREMRQEISKESGREITLEWLLYDPKGATMAEKLWRAFEAGRREDEIVEDEDHVEAERSLGWGWGEMGRDANNEANLAERGYGE